MQISISGNPAKPKIDPDPAYVTVGDAVQWRVNLDPIDGFDVECEVYFSSGRHPFGPSANAPWTLKAGAVVNAGATAERGDYKYGVRTSRTPLAQTIPATTGVTLSDDDPRLIVA